jgi:spermidine/putrescine transport system substrate-binding protein
MKTNQGLRHSFPFAQFVGQILCLAAILGASAHAEPLHILCWSEYIPPTVVQGFEKFAGARVQLETYDSNEQMLGKLRARAGYYDLVQPSGFYVEILARGGELEPLDFARIPNAGNLDPEYRHLPFDPEAKYSVPWMAGTVGIVVNTVRVAEPITTWAEVFSGRHAGRIVAVDDAREMVAWALASLDLPVTDVSDAALARVEPLLREWLPQIAVFDSNSPHEALLDGRAEIGIVWSGEAALLWQKDRIKFRYLIPPKGAHRFVDNLAIPKAAPHRPLAERFIDYCLRPEVSLEISRAYPYTNPNAAARRLLTPDESENPASYPPGISTQPMLRNEGNTTAAVTAFVTRLREQARK